MGILEQPAVPQHRVRPRVREALIAKMAAARLEVPEANVAEMLAATICLISRQANAAIAIADTPQLKAYNREGIRQALQIVLMELADPENKQ